MTDRPIVPTHHAIEQAIERWEDFGTDYRTAHDKIRNEVAQGIADGCVSRKRPRWARADYLKRWTAKTKGQARFVWTLDRGRVYVIHRYPKKIVVVTTLPPVQQEAA